MAMINAGEVIRALLFLSALLILLLVAFCSPAHAQAQNCAPRTQMLDLLETRYGETRQAVGLAANNQVVELFASLETGTWSLTVTDPGGPTCMVAAGEAFERLSGTKRAAQL
jgi:hypothetical protein